MSEQSSFRSKLLFVNSRSPRCKVIRSHVVREATTRRSLRRREGFSTLPEGCNTTFTTSATIDDHRQHVIRTASSRSLFTIGFSGTRRDPFNAYPVPILEWVPLATDFYMSHAASSDATFILFGAQNHYRGWLFTRMLHHSGLFHAIMAICLAQMQTLLPSADPRAPQQMAYHRGCAIAVVKHGLEDLGRLAEYAVIETIVALANVEIQCHDYVSFEHHLAGLRALLGSLGNLEGLDKNLISYLVYYDYLFQIKMHCQSVFTGSIFTRRKTYVEYHTSQRLSDVVSKFPSGLRDLVAQGHYSWNDSQHRRQVKSYVSKRAYWIERQVRFDIRCPLRSKPPLKGREAIVDTHVFQSSAIQHEHQHQWDEPKSTAFTWHDDEDAVAANVQRKVKIKVQVQDKSQAKVLRRSQGFLAANEFYQEAVDPHYAPVCRIFDVVNCFGNNYHTQMQQDEVALHAGVAAVQVMKGMFISACPCPADILPEDILRLVHIAISMLRQRIARNDSCNDDVTIMTVVFLTHLAMAFQDMEAFRSHRRAIKQMVDSRGGLHRLSQDLLVGPTVRQFELWWSQLHGDGVFEAEECRIVNGLHHPLEPDLRDTVNSLPLGFQALARRGHISNKMLILLGRISHFDQLNRTNKLLAREMLLAGTTGNNTNKRKYNNFNEACPALSSLEPSLEKNLAHALLLYCNLTFSPKRALLEACNLIFSIPRAILIKELPSFDEASAAGARTERPPEHESELESSTLVRRQCVLWIWLVLISSLIIANTKKSSLETELAARLAARYPACRRWVNVEAILTAFFASEVVMESLHRHWNAMRFDVSDPED
ncbi:hypothetical protein PV04_09099 [Phialophora macrospora]|uniref:Transcription factor domain-containing protein n=1 Tax=Phialophora macrospora TaxID=1851006 RepID=A0A0D2FVX1_9EURO|nr:hypothetical protein PV04_09099 [Phialophora macrospora]